MAGLCEGGNEPRGSLKARYGYGMSPSSDFLEISTNIWDRCPQSIVVNLRSYINCPKTGLNFTSDTKKAPLMRQLGQKRNPVANTSYNGWRDHRANHTIPPFWLDDRPPLLRHVGVRPAAGWSF
ncbi:hypothetical protein ANN_11465 [Periplaneta americana]|uniref:Uncharacterized protein n=1 Tax=Periplaneta americana TaxID=6978 RepID=A0ABQ8T536_PERAM|nr:hypothetical protein ANN_11465 [Periplaneta americana]